MDLPLDSIALPPWDPARADEWNEAYEKVENYLRACRVSSHLQRARLIALILQRVYDRTQADASAAGRPLPELAIVEARERIVEWIGHYLGKSQSIVCDTHKGVEELDVLITRWMNV